MDNSNLSFKLPCTKISESFLKELLDSHISIIIMDVRTCEEFEEGHIPESINVPIEEFEEILEKLNPDRKITIVIYCESGLRSLEACYILKRFGFYNIYNLGPASNWHSKLVQ